MMNKSSFQGTSPERVKIIAKKVSTSNNNNKQKSSLVSDSAYMNYVMKKLNAFLKRRPTIESLKREGIFKG
jgi:hypothetical protein